MNQLFKIGCLLILALGVGFWPTTALAGYTGYSWRASLTIPYTWFATDLANFPVLITASSVPAALFDYANADGGDIRFSTDTAGDVPLNREIVAYNNTTDTMEAWVKVPSVSSTTDTVIYIWYGNAGASEPAANDADEGSQGVWDANFKGVYHLQEAVNNDNAGYKDSTANARHLTGTSMASTSLSGRWVGGLAANFGGDSNYLSTTTLITAAPVTVSAWARISTVAISSDIFSIRSSNNENRFALALPTTWNFINRYPIWQSKMYNSPTEATHSNLSINTWYHFAGVENSSTSRYVYKNGVASSQNMTDRSPVGVSSIIVGAGHEDLLDEIRLSNTSRSTAWIAAEYNSGNVPGNIVDGEPVALGGDSVSRVIRLTGGLRLLGGARLLGND